MIANNKHINPFSKFQQSIRPWTCTLHWAVLFKIIVVIERITCWQALIEDHTKAILHKLTELSIKFQNTLKNIFVLETRMTTSTRFVGNLGKGTSIFLWNAHPNHYWKGTWKTSLGRSIMAMKSLTECKIWVKVSFIHYGNNEQIFVGRRKAPLSASFKVSWSKNHEAGRTPLFPNPWICTAVIYSKVAQKNIKGVKTFKKIDVFYTFG